jgi:hypothetical protein
MEILLEIRPWRLFYAQLGPRSYEMLLERRPWRLLYAQLAPWFHGNVTTDKILASFVFPTWSLVLWKYY